MSSPRPPARQRLLDATAELTYRDGVEATGVDAIARRAEVTKRTLYQHFRSKDALVAESLRTRDEPEIERLRGLTMELARRDGIPPILALFDVLATLATTPAMRGCAFLNVSVELGDRDHPAVAAAHAHLNARRAFVVELLDASGMDTALADELALIIDGFFAGAASQRGEAAAVHARRLAERLCQPD